ncbi:hypothetical protein [Aeoliella sp.]|uniref:hypothetical protein n=1 Tax=Aeoliella sp. TaxID=2795800 RepID=UPI003CCC35E1
MIESAVLAQTEGSEVLTLGPLIQQVSIQLVVTLVGVLGSLLIAARTDWFRRLAGWEPYGQEIWREKFKHYSNIVSCGGELLRTTSEVLQQYEACEKADGVVSQEEKTATNYGEVVWKLMSDSLGEPLITSFEVDQSLMKLIDSCLTLGRYVATVPSSKQSIQKAHELASNLSSDYFKVQLAMKHCLGVPTFEAAQKSQLLELATKNRHYLTAPPQPPHNGS